jgi:GxxExxY protein
MPCLQFELDARNLRFVAQRPIPIVYKGLALGAPYRVDLIVEEQVVVELKCVERLLGVHDAQTLTHMGLTGCQAGLLINFNVSKLTDGVRRLLRPQRR